MFKNFFEIRRQMTSRAKLVLALMSFIVPILIWSALSYIPFIYHPLVEIENAGDSFYCQKGDLLEIANFQEMNAQLKEDGSVMMTGKRVNPPYISAPHDVVVALYTSFTTPPKRDTDKWLYESLQDSIKLIFLSFFLSSLVGVPIGILCGAFNSAESFFQPVIEFVRYFPAPVFATLAVALLGINEAPKIAIIIIGTLFQQIPMIANTTRTMDMALIDAAETMGASRKRILFKVVVPAILPKLYKDMRILLGWAWTYLIVAEVVGTTSGISWFITQQAKYRNFDNVYAAIIIISMIGLFTDLILARLAVYLFPWESNVKSKFYLFFTELFGQKEKCFSFIKDKEYN